MVWCILGPMKQKPSSSAGNVLFYILIATVLFAALTMSVNYMMRGSSGGDSSTRELRRVYASEVIQYGSALRGAVQTIRVSGLTDSQISFNNNIVAGYNNACPGGGDDCKVFDADGGGMVYNKPSDDWLALGQPGGDWVFSGNNEIVGVGTDGGGASSVELLAVLPWIKKELCTSINELLDIPNPGGEPPQDSGNIDVTTKFNGVYTASQAIGGGDPEIEERRAGCVEGAGTPAAGTYHFFQVLLAR